MPAIVMPVMTASARPVKQYQQRSDEHAGECPHKYGGGTGRVEAFSESVDDRGISYDRDLHGGARFLGCQRGTAAYRRESLGLHG